MEIGLVWYWKGKEETRFLCLPKSRGGGGLAFRNPSREHAVPVRGAVLGALLLGKQV